MILRLMRIAGPPSAGLALAIAVSGCFSNMMLPGGPMTPGGSSGPGGQPQTEYEKKFLQQFEQAAFSISGGDIFIRSDAAEPWLGVNITLDTDDGYFRRKAGDMEPGQVCELPLRSFVDSSGNAFGAGIRLKSVWVQARHPDGAAVNEMAFPAQTFGFKSPVPPGS